MIVEVNLGHLFSEQTCRVEIQLRTSAMDFWATLEHKVRYKYDGQIPEQLSGELQNCAEQIHALDERMYLIHKVVDMINQSEVDIEQIGLLIKLKIRTCQRMDNLLYLLSMFLHTNKTVHPLSLIC